MISLSRPTRHDLPYYVLLLVLGLLTFYPFLFTLFTSLKDNDEFFHTLLVPTLPLHWSNYADAWVVIAGSILNTMGIAAVSVIAGLLFASLSAYVFARFSFPARTVLFYLILALMMVPGIFTLIPLYLEVKSFHLMNTYGALVFPYIAGAQAFNIFVLRTFFASLPEELFESARLDGAGERIIFARIAVPLSRPILVSVAILGVLGIWNDYLWPALTLSDPAMWTISMALVSFAGQYAQLQQWGPMFAGYVIATVPLIVMFFFTMRYFVEGLASGAIKL
jgi:ABC-type glycerol-3-phosphate transport system permease component